MKSPVRFASTLSETPIPEVEATLAPSTQHGADIRFHGVVRDTEEGAPIVGIEYTCYEKMARTEFERIGAAMLEEHPEHLAFVHHRIGFVRIGEASILIRVLTRHSAEGFDLSREYLRQIKTSVPIWKKIVPADAVSSEGTAPSSR